MIVDFRALVGHQRVEVEQILGEGRNGAAIEAGLLWTHNGALVTRNYDLGAHTLNEYFALDHNLRELQVVSGLREDNYPLEDWPSVLAETGFPNNTAPNYVAPTTLRCDNLDGHIVWIAASGTEANRNVWTI